MPFGNIMNCCCVPAPGCDRPDIFVCDTPGFIVSELSASTVGTDRVHNMRITCDPAGASVHDFQVTLPCDEPECQTVNLTGVTLVPCGSPGEIRVGNLPDVCCCGAQDCGTVNPSESYSGTYQIGCIPGFGCTPLNPEPANANDQVCINYYTGGYSELVISDIFSITANTPIAFEAQIANNRMRMGTTDVDDPGALWTVENNEGYSQTFPAIPTIRYEYDLNWTPACSDANKEARYYVNGQLVDTGTNVILFQFGPTYQTGGSDAAIATVEMTLSTTWAMIS